MTELHYNAFISYRHNERDSRIAGSIQRELERFHIPAAIRKSSGINKIERIFRDKEELPITIDLSDNIGQALMHSDFLIVICSPELKESRWCMHEIETFLKLHPRDHVLTVLTEGEPGDVIPEMLLKETRVFTLEDGTTFEEVYESEPLSCDYREAARGGAKELRKATREELPRLVACMLGCAYDELVRRQHQYRMRRLITASSIAAVLMIGAISYLLWSRNAIHNQYIQTLRSQSVNLAGESLSLLEEDDRIGALQLALAALPDEKVPERPVTSKAMYAITQALYAYNVPGQKVCTWIFNTPFDVVSYGFSSDMKYLLAMDSEGLLSVHDIETRERTEVWEIGGQNDIPGFIPVGTEEAILWRSNIIFAMNYVKGEQLWVQQFERSFTNAVLADTSDGSLLFVENQDSLYVLNPEDGEILSEYHFPETAAGSSWFDGKYGMAVSPDGNLCACVKRYQSISLFTGSAEYKMTVSVWDRQSGTVSDIPLSFGKVEGLCFSGSSELIACGRETPYSYSEMAISSALVEDDPLRIAAVRYSEDGLSVLWTGEYTYSQEPAKVILETVPFRNDGEQVLAVFSGNVLILDKESGAALLEKQIRGNVTSKLFCDENALTLVSEEGEKISLEYVTKSIFYEPVYVDDISNAFSLVSREFILRDGRVYLYEQLTNRYLTFLNDIPQIPYSSGRSSLVSGGILATLLQEPAVIMTDTATGSVSYYPLEGAEFDWTLIGALPEEEYGCAAFLLEGTAPMPDLQDSSASSESSEKTRRIIVLCADGRTETVCGTDGVGLTGEGLFFTYAHAFEESGTSLYYFDRDTCKSLLRIPLSGIKEKTASSAKPEEITFDWLPENLLFLRAYRKDLTSSSTLYFPSPVYLSHSGELLFTTAVNAEDGSNIGVIADLSKGTAVTIDSISGDGLLRAAWKDDDSLVAVSDDQALFIIDTSGNIVHTIPLQGKRAESLAYMGDELLALFNNHTLARYDQEINTLSETALKYTDDYTGLVEQVTWTRKDPYLYLQIDDEINIIDMTDWSDTPAAAVPDALGFVPETGLFCISSQSAEEIGTGAGIMKIGTLPHLTTSQLIEWGNQELNGLEPDEEMKARYGLN